MAGYVLGPGAISTAHGPDRTLDDRTEGRNPYKQSDSALDYSRDHRLTETGVNLPRRLRVY